MGTTKGQRMDPAAAAALVRSRDTITTGFVSGQAVGLLQALGERDDLEDVTLVNGILVQPYAFLQKRTVRVASAFFGPIERMGRKMGAWVEFLAVDFHGLERLMLRERPRVVLAVTSPPDADGWLSFGSHAGATYRPFVEAARDPERLAIAEVNPRMPRVAGLPEYGAHRIHLSEVDAWVEYEHELVVPPAESPVPEASAIAERAVGLIEHGATLQFGIGAVPDETARLLAAGPLGDFGVHSEMISDGLMALHRAGKVNNAHKGLYDGVSVGTFAFGSAELYAWLDGNRDVRMLPVSLTNEPGLLHRLRSFVSINGALAIDLLGQVAADHVGGRQYSGVGGRGGVRAGRVGGAGRQEPALPRVHHRRRRAARLHHRAAARRRRVRHHTAAPRAVGDHGVRRGRPLGADRRGAGAGAHRAGASRLPRRAGAIGHAGADSCPMSIANVGGLELYYEEHGSGDPLLLIMGLAADSTAWAFQIPELSRHYRTIAFDNRGVGRSAKPAGPVHRSTRWPTTPSGCSTPSGIERAHVLGVSMGGMIAQELALRHPRSRARPRPRVHVSRARRRRGEHLHVLDADSSAAASAATVELEIDLKAINPMDFFQHLLPTVFNPEFIQQELPKLIQVFSGALQYGFSMEAILGQVEAVMGHQATDRLHRITAPTLVLTGDADRLIPPANSDLLAQHIPGAKLVKIPGGSHGFNFETPETFNREVLDFLATVER